MKKRPFKVMALSAVIAAVTVSNVVPTHSLAAENSTQIIQNNSNDTKKIVLDASNKVNEYEYKLGPDGLREAMEQTGSNALVMDLYALTLIKQQNADFTDVTSVPDDLAKNITNHQNTSRDNARRWLDDIHPKLINTNQDIINYNTKFQNYYDDLVAAVDAKDKEWLKAGLNNLNKDISKYKGRVDEAIQDLRTLRDDMGNDTQSIKTDTNNLISILNSQESGLPALQQQIDACNGVITQGSKNIVAAAAALGLGTIFIIAGGIAIGIGSGGWGIPLVLGGVGAIAGGTYLMVETLRSMNVAREGIRTATLELNNTKAQMVVVTNIKNQSSNLSETIDIAMGALQSMSDQWQVLSAKYSSLIDNIDAIDPDELYFIKSDLNTAKVSWDDIANYARRLYEDIKVEAPNQ
ncbi:HBL/NHE enterotoxin family protein [Bacillus cereus]|uniref:HBL/NHE enterotoxin family protein n=1 Tax=Bacillus cereus TaxID=1396 RepID=UPI000278FB2D|nr:HBL/NHE enterotoxin family protein [Bacillus cereus]EJP84951.1 hypothetical protein IC3_04773 [Bacillus cereus VD142]